MRKILFWCHLIAGTVAGIIVLVMCVTGVLLMYERQMVAWADRGFRSIPPSDGATHLSPEAVIEGLQESKKAIPVSITFHSEPDDPAEASFGAGQVLYLDAYTGKVLGEGSKGIRSFFRAVTDWHRWLAMQGSNRPFGRAVTGASNLAFLFLVLSGMYLWLPRKWSWRNVRSVLFFRGGPAGKARDFNWHNVIGIWSAVPLIFIVLGGLVISFPWATNLLYKITASEPPPAPSAPATSGPTHSGVVGLNRAWSQAEQRVPGWQTISLRLPAPNQQSFDLSIAESHRGRPDKRHLLVVDRASGEVVKAEDFSGYNLGRRIRMWLRFLHTGEALGAFGQTVAGIVSAGGGVLVWTGIALCWRRFRGWQRRQPTRVEETTAVSG